MKSRRAMKIDDVGTSFRKMVQVARGIPAPRVLIMTLSMRDF
jgi:hypothetical protein